MRVSLAFYIMSCPFCKFRIVNSCKSVEISDNCSYYSHPEADYEKAIVTDLALKHNYDEITKQCCKCEGRIHVAVNLTTTLDAKDM